MLEPTQDPFTETHQDHLLAIDALNVARRVYEANPAPDSAEKAKSAVRAIRLSLIRALNEHAPTHLLVALDAGGPTWRHALNADYKKNRKPMPEELRTELEMLWQDLRNKGWAIARVPGVEADDALASAARLAQAAGLRCTVLSTDKDMLYLLSYGARVYDHFGRLERNVEWCHHKLGIEPVQVLDWLALMGDATDSIAGIDKVGKKTAAKMLKMFGTLDKVLEQAQRGAVPGVLGKRLCEQAHVARAARQLTELRTDCFANGLPWPKLTRFSKDIAPAPL